MKIEEAVKNINRADTVHAKVDGDCLCIFSRDEIVIKNSVWFMKINTKAASWNKVCKNWHWLDNVEPKDLASTIEVIQRLLDTPVKERFTEKKYRLVANPNSFEQTGTYATKYVACIEDSMDSFSFIYGGPTIFSEKELKLTEKLHPNIAPAIEAMKEEAKDDEEQN